MNHEKWLAHTIELAIQNVRNGGGPFSAIVVKDGKIIGQGSNQVHVNFDPSAHAELIAIKQASAYLQSTDLSECVLYASGEPCPMCLGAAYWTTVGEIYFACSKTDAENDADFGNPLYHFYTDQQLKPTERAVPFIHLKVSQSLAPFEEWNRLQNNE